MSKKRNGSDVLLLVILLLNVSCLRLGPHAANNYRLSMNVGIYSLIFKSR